MENFATMHMTKAELERYFKTNISQDLFNQMSKIDWNEKELVDRWSSEDIAEYEALELSVEYAWKQAIFEENREKEIQDLLAEYEK